LSVRAPRTWLHEKPVAVEIPDRWEKENANWPFENYSQSDGDPVRDKLAAILGLDKTMESVRQARQYGHSIGKAVGREHSVGWLAIDLKLEHFIQDEGEHVWHIDHSDDIWMLRDPTTEEMSATLVPLYQQMDYIQWQGFREGYFDVRGVDSSEVIRVFDKESTARIFLLYCLERSRALRRKGDKDQAITTCKNMLAIASRFGGDKLQRSIALLRSRSILADVHLHFEEFEQAAILYRETLAQLCSDNLEGAELLFEECGARINLSIAEQRSGNSGEALEQLRTARACATKLASANDARSESILDAINKNEVTFRSSLNRLRAAARR
jgi:hypothetical protein